MNIRRLFRARGQARRRSRRSPRRARLFLEALEMRCTPTVSLTNGQLTVAGDDSSSFGGFDDTITLDVNSRGGVAVILNGQQFDFSAGQVFSSIVVNAGAGENSIKANAVPGALPLTLNCLGSPDIVTLGGDQFTGNLAQMGGLITIHGDLSTQVTLNDPFRTDATLQTYTITSSTVKRLGFSGLSYSGVGELTLAGKSDSTYDVLSTARQCQYGLLPGHGLNTYNLGTGNLDALPGSVAILHDPGPDSTPDQVILHDEACPTDQTYDIESFLSITFRRGGFQLDVINNNTVTIDAGPGNDTFDVALPVGVVTIHGGVGHNTLDFSTAQSPSAVTVTSSSVADSFSNVTYSAVQTVVIDATQNGDSVNVLSTAPGRSLTLNGSAQVTVGNAIDGLGDIKGGFSVLESAFFGTELTIDDTAGTVTGAQYFVLSNRVSLGFTQISYSDIDSLTLDSGRGGNTIIIGDIPASMATTINAGPSADLIQLSGSLVGSLGNTQGPLTINGQGNTTLTAFDQSTSTPQTYTLTGTATGANLTRSGGFNLTTSNLKSLNLTAGSGGNQFVVAAAPATTAATLNGGSGTNTLTGPNGATSWSITGAGIVKIGTKVTFTGIANLVGGAGNDVFRFSAAGSLAGTLSGGSGSDQLNYSAEAGPVTVNLQTLSAQQILGGAAAGFNGIETIVGSASTADTLIGPNVNTTWIVNGSGAGRVGGGIFAGFENLVGGSGVDVFRFTGVGSLKGTLDGGAAPVHQGNWLDYSGFIAPLSINLQTGTAPGVTGSVRNIQNVHGGDAGNTLVGNALGNILIGGAGADVLTGGSGPSLLIGELGADSITGGSGGDILIGDATSFDAMTAGNEKALMAILSEWQSADSYATRFSDINTGTGGGLNGSFKLNFGTTVKDDGVADTVTAAPSAQALDWFFQGTGDTLKHVEVGEHINNNTPAAFQNRTVTSPIAEGSLATLSGTITDPDPGDPFTLVVNWGDGSPTQTYTFPPGSNGQGVSVTHRYRDDGAYTIALSWTDPTGPANQATLPITVTNVAPTVHVGGDASLKAGQTLERKGSFDDPGTDNWTATVDYGDGMGPQPLRLQDHSFQLHHKYRHAGTYRVVVTVIDDDGGVGTGAFTVTVA
jgi:hypothetical protein